MLNAYVSQTNSIYICTRQTNSIYVFVTQSTTCECASKHCIHFIIVVNELPMLSIKLTDTFAVLNVIRFPKSYDLWANCLTSDLVLSQRLVLSSFTVALIGSIIVCCCLFCISFGRAITMAAPTDNAHNNAQ